MSLALALSFLSALGIATTVFAQSSPVAESNSFSQQRTYTVGIPVGTAAGMVNPTALNQWAQRNGLAQTWKLKPGSTIDTIYETAVSTGTRGSKPTLQDVRGWKEKPGAVNSVIEYSNRKDVQRLMPGNYAGQFLFGAKPTAPLETESQRVLKSAQITVSFIKEDLEAEASKGPSISGFPNISDKLSFAIPMQTVKPLADPKRPALQFVELTDEAWRDFIRTFPTATVEAGDYPIDVRFAGTSTQASPPLFTNEDRDAIKATLVRPSVTFPVLIILDDSWPSDASEADAIEFKKSVEFFCDGLDELWKKVAMGYDYPDRPCPDSLRKAASPGVPQGFKCSPGEDCRTHSLKIKQALAEMTALVGPQGAQPVKVVYLPFNAAQSYAWDILSRLMVWHGVDQPSRVPHIRGVTKDNAIDAYKEIMAKTYETIPKTLQRGTEVTSTSVAIFNAVMTFARKYSLLKGEPVFINASWTFQDIDAPLANANSGFNLVFAAAGGDCDPNAAERCVTDYVSRNAIAQFVKETEKRSNFVGVMSLAEDGTPSCKSTRLLATNVALGFSGVIDGDCGTSFASPRVAWLYALYEAKAARLPSMAKSPARGAPSAWSIAAMQRIQRFTSCQGTLANDYSCMQFSPRKIFKTVNTENKNE